MLAQKWRILFALMFLSVLLTAGQGAPKFDPAVGSPRLQQALASAPDDAVHKVWVHFENRMLAGAELEAALDLAEAELTPRAARRRAKMHAPGERLVEVRDLPLDSHLLAACSHTGAQLHQQSRWLNAASFRATNIEVAQLTQLSGVKKVDLVAVMQRAAVPTPVGKIENLGNRPGTEFTKTTTIDYGANLDAMVQANVVAAHDMGLSGQGVLVGMLDTGFRTTHESMVHIPVLDVWDFVNNDGNVDDEGLDPVGSNSHGTMTLSTVAGHMPGQLVAPAYAASVVLGKTEDIAVEIVLEEDNWVAGLEWAEALGADIVSSSLGYIDWYVFEDLDGNTAITTIAADLAVARGVIVINSAGNERSSSGMLIAPADGDSVITVGAVDDLDAVSWFSSPGPTADGRIKPDIAALGVSNTVADPTDDLNYLGVSGTSFSCPLTSGVVALMIERVPGLTPMQVLEALRATASQSATPDNDLGWGIIDAAAAATWFAPVITHDPLPPTTDLAGPYMVSGLFIDRVGLNTGSPFLWYRINSGAWQSVAMAATGLPGWFAADIPAQPAATVVDYYLTAASVNGLASSYPFAGDTAPFSFTVVAPSQVGEDGLPALTHLAANVPNPFNPQTAISFTLARSGPASLRVYNLRGQLVRTLLDGDLAEGHHTANWDGRDLAGRAVSSGTYFYRLEGAGTLQQRKMQLVR